jgi:hypothetical protein
MKTPNIKVKTQFGTLIAEVSPDPEYPAIWLSLIDERGSEIPLVTTEQDMDRDGEEALRTVVYKRSWCDEPSHIITHELEQGFMS